MSGRWHVGCEQWLASFYAVYSSTHGYECRKRSKAARYSLTPGRYLRRLPLHAWPKATKGSTRAAFAAASQPLTQARSTSERCTSQETTMRARSTRSQRKRGSVNIVGF